jgi:hypothetical protein
MIKAIVDDSKNPKYERLKKNAMDSIDAVETLGNTLFMAQMIERNGNIGDQLGFLLKRMAVLEANQDKVVDVFCKAETETA